MQEKASSASFAHLGRKYLQPSSQVRAIVPASTCGEKTSLCRNLFPHVFLLIHEYFTELVLGVRECMIRKKNRRLR